MAVATEAYECMYLGHISLLFSHCCWKGRKGCSQEKTLSVVENTGKSKIRLEEGVGDECGEGGDGGSEGKLSCGCRPVSSA